MKKNKKIILIGFLILIFISLIIGELFLFGGTKENKKDIVNNYIVYIKINPVIKLEISQICRNTNDKDNINNDCDNPVVKKYELINKDAQTIYKDIDLLDVTDQLWSVMTLISETAKEYNINVDTVDVYSDWKKIDEFINNQTNSEYTWTYNINIKESEELEDIGNSFGEEKVIYTVTFDTDGGSVISKQEVENGNKISRPADPTKNGYEFVEWLLDNKKFDLNSLVTKDITLKAKWKKKENVTNNIQKEEKPNNSNNVQSNNDNSNNKQEEQTNYFYIPWEIINDGTYEKFAREHGITINLVADDQYKCNSHFSEPADPKGYKKGDVVIAYGFMGEVCVENCDGCSNEECITNPPRFEKRFQFGACGVG